MLRRQTLPVKVGALTIGGTAPVSVQTMCNTLTTDIAASFSQCRTLTQAGAQLIRLTTPTFKDVSAFADTARALRTMNLRVPLAADVHFSSRIAKAAAAVADKVRINPGNFAKNPVQMEAELMELIQICKQNGTALRIGVNQGSLNPKMMELYGNTPRGMAEGAMEYLKLCRQAGFEAIVVSMKSSNTRVMTEAYRLLVQLMDAADMHYPLHIGVTESGDGRPGRLKSACACAALLQEGIGDTLRISLTEDPVNEISFGNTFLNARPNDGAGNQATHYEASHWDELLSKISWQWGPSLLRTGWEGPAPELSARIDGREVPAPIMREIVSDLLQACRCRFSKNEYIACPGCGRTQYRLQEALAAVKAATAHLNGYTIAVMGCIVNGPGEMADADFGYVGEGGGYVSLYKKKEVIQRHIPEAEAPARLAAVMEASASTDKTGAV